MAENVLYYGDNLEVLKKYIADDSIDLVYLDPPFNSNRDYNVIFGESGDPNADAQRMAFGDTWHWTKQTEEAFNELGQIAPPRLVEMMNGFVSMLGRNDLTAYLMMLGGRLVQLHRVLKPTGALFLHCDPTASHYIKVMLDAIFGRDKMINQFTWKRSSAHSDAKQGAKHAGRISDIIFWYAKGDEWTHNIQYIPYSKDYIKSTYNHTEEGTKRRYALDNLTGPGGKRKGNPEYELMGVTRYWRYSKENMDVLLREGRIVQDKPGKVPRYKRYLDEMPGVALQDIWTDINPVQGRSKEWLGYPTQKPIKLLERIVKMASNPGDKVLDPFCGCGTTIAACESLGNRNWIGIDITFLATSMIENRLHTQFPGSQYRLIGQPNTISGARELARQDSEEFEYWALRLVGARPAEGEQKKGADGGTDGVLFFPDPKTRKQTRVSVQVKGWKRKVGPESVRAFGRVIERDKAAIGLFLTLSEPTKAMQIEAASVGKYKVEYMGGELEYPRLQILSIEGLLEEKESAKLPLGITSGLKPAEKFRPKPEDFTQNMFVTPPMLDDDEDDFSDDQEDDE